MVTGRRRSPRPRTSTITSFIVPGGLGQHADGDGAEPGAEPAVAPGVSTVYNALGRQICLGQGVGYGDTMTLDRRAASTAGSQLLSSRSTAPARTAFGTGAYALTLNLGNNPLPAVPPPNTTKANGSPLTRRRRPGRAGQPGDPGQHHHRPTSRRSTTTTEKAVAIDANGNYVVTWQSQNQDGSGWGVYAQRFDVNGNKLGGEFRVNTTTNGDQTNPAVAMDPGGDFVITWQSQGQDGSGWGVYAQRYNASGVRAGRRVPGQHHHQRRPDRTRRWRWTRLGDFAVTWQSHEPGRQRLGRLRPAVQRSSACRWAASSGSTPPPRATRPTRRSAMDRLGDFVVAWQSNGQDGNGWGIYAQRYSRPRPAAGGRVPGQHHHRRATRPVPVGGDGRPRRLRDRLAEQRPGHTGASTPSGTTSSAARPAASSRSAPPRPWTSCTRRRRWTTPATC